MIYQSNSDIQTKKIAQALAQKLLSSPKLKVLALTGNLGVGKTTFAQGFAKGLGIKERIISPTFILMRQHHIPKTSKVFYHLDLYRLDNPQEIKELGLSDLFNTNGMVLIEWAEKIEDKLPQQTIKIRLEKTSINGRKITIEDLKLHGL